MYSVVGCSDCQSLWIVEGRPETTSCPRCRSRHTFKRLKKFVQTEEKAEAMEIRSAMLAAKQGQGEAYEQLDSVSEMEAVLEEIGIEDTEYLTEKGVDAAEVEAAGAAATESNPRKPKRERVLDALRELDEPDESAIIAFAGDRGVSPEYVKSVLQKLTRMGEITQTRDGYRLL